MLHPWQDDDWGYIGIPGRESHGGGGGDELTFWIQGQGPAPGYSVPVAYMSKHEDADEDHAGATLTPCYICNTGTTVVEA